ncbi:ABC-three component system protein [Marinobacter sp. W-8]|uniref:ABC-three component system protein n=1 Tax=Marinobacter sp. W-8 TaxID=3369658 RepID=UPI0037CACE5F
MTTTSAGGQMAGYLWQASEACRRALTSPNDAIVKIEIEDDLSVASMEGVIQSCEQLKHSEYIQSISESSPIWWQAIDAWIRGPAPENSKLRLVTTSNLKPSSLLASCYLPTGLPPWESLLDEMNMKASEAANKQLAEKGVYARWSALGHAQRKLLTRIEIASSQNRLAATNDQLDETLMDRGVSPLIVSQVRESLVGAFMTRLTNSLDSGGFEVSVKAMNVDFLEAHARHAEFGNYDFPDLEYTEEEVYALRAEHHQHLIPQLVAIKRDQPNTIARALKNWFEARALRQELMDGAPHVVQDLKKHDKNLEDYCQTLHEEHLPAKDAEHAMEVGRDVHSSCMKYQSKLGRTDPPLQFTQGSYHEMSNALRLKWNPSYEEEK